MAVPEWAYVALAELDHAMPLTNQRLGERCANFEGDAADFDSLLLELAEYMADTKSGTLSVVNTIVSIAARRELLSHPTITALIAAYRAPQAAYASEEDILALYAHAMSTNDEDFIEAVLMDFPLFGFSALWFRGVYIVELCEKFPEHMRSYKQ